MQVCKITVNLVGDQIFNISFTNFNLTGAERHSNRCHVLTGSNASEPYSARRRFLLFHLFLKTEHAVEVLTFIIVFFAGLRIMWVGMMTVEKLDNMEPAFVDIEVDVPCFKIWGTGLPDNGIGI